MIWTAVVVTAALIQTTWLDGLLLGGVHPDLILVLVIFFAIGEGPERAMFTGALGGVFEDVARGAVLGHHVLCNVVVAYAAGRLASRLITEHPAMRVGLVLAAGIAQGVLYEAVYAVQRPGAEVFRGIVAKVIPGAFFTALIAAVALPLLDRFYQSSRNVQGGTM